MPGIFLAAVLFGGIAQAAPSPSSPHWALQVGPAYCRLESQGTEQSSTLLIDTTPGSDSYRLLIAGKDVRGSESLVPASLTFSSPLEALNGLASVTKLPNGTPSIWMEGIAPSLLEKLAVAEVVTITTKSNSGGTVAVSGAAKAIAAFRKCSADQLIEWGADAAQFVPGGRAPIALKDRDNWISNRDFLRLSMGESDIDAVFRVSVSGSGAIEDCHAVTAKIAEGITKVACAAVLNKPLFSPARSASGTPVRGVATFRVMMIRRRS